MVNLSWHCHLVIIQRSCVLFNGFRRCLQLISVPQVEKYMACIPAKRYKRWQKYRPISTGRDAAKKKQHSFLEFITFPSHKETKTHGTALKGSSGSLSFLMFFVVKLLQLDYDSLVQTICFKSSMLSKTYVFCGIVVGDTLRSHYVWLLALIQVWPEFAKTWPGTRWQTR